MKAMVFAAGLGTRLENETRYKPKALVEIAGKPLLQLVVEKLSSEGINEVVVNVHHFSEQVVDFVKRHDFGIPVKISDESEKLLDTGGGLKKASRFFSGQESVLIYNVDVISNLNLRLLMEEHFRTGAMATLVVRDRETQRYFKFNHEKRLVGWENITTGETKISVPEEFEDAVSMAFSGIHIINPAIFNLFPAEDRFSITGFYVNIAFDHIIKGYFDESDLWMDLGKPNQLREIRKKYNSMD